MKTKLQSLLKTIYIVTFSIFIFVSSGMQNTVSAANDKITITKVSWDAGIIIAEAIKNIIEKNYGVDVDIKESGTDDAFMDMDASIGRIDIFPDLWMPNQKSNWEKYVIKKGTVLSNETPYSADQGLYIASTNSRLTQADNTTNVSVLSDPSLITLFDSDNNGKGEYWPGAPKWGARNLMRIKIKTYGLEEYWEEIDATHEAFMDILKKRYERNVSTLFYYWEPEWLFKNYATKKISEPVYSEGCKEIADEKEPDWLEKSKFGCAFPATTVHVMYSKRLLTDYPSVSKMLKNITINVDDINEALFEKNVLNTSIESIIGKFSEKLLLGASSIDSSKENSTGNLARSQD